MTGDVGGDRVGSATEGRTSTSGTIGFVATLAIAMGIGPLLLHALTAMSPLIVADLGLSRTQFGTLSTTAFLTAGLTSVVSGVAVDRISERRMMALLFIGSAVALGAAAAVPGYGWLLAVVIFSGALQAMSNPITNRLVAAVPDPAARGTMMGVKQAGVQMAQAFAGFALPGLALVARWRGSLASAALLALVGLALSVRYIRDTDRALAASSATSTRRGQLPAAVWWLAAYAFLLGAATQGINVYLPLYGYEVLGLPSAIAGALTAVVGVLGLLSRIMWGRIASRSAAPRLAMAVLAVGAAAGVGLILLAAHTHVSFVWFGAALFGATGLAANVVLMVTVMRLVPPGLVGRATGTLATGLYLGFATGPVSFGGVVDALGDYRMALGGAAGVFLVAGALAVARREWTPASE